MRKTLQDLSGYLQTILMPDTDEAYPVKPQFLSIASEGAIRKGIPALRAFLYRLYGELAIKGDAHDAHKKLAHGYENRVTLSGYYPFLNDIKIILMKAGLRGVLAKDGQALLCDGTIFPEKLSTPKTLECLRFLADCGLGIDGVDLNEKKQNLADLQGITLTYPDDPALLVGMKVMATAEVELGTLDNQDLFMRCDYRVVKAEETPVLSVLTDTIRYLPEDVQAFVLRLHHRYTDMGLTCALEIKGYYTYIKYMYKRKDVWGFNNSMSNGYHINVKAANLDRYPDTIAALPPVLQAEIAKGFGCGRKREGIGHCDGGCRGLIVPLDEAVLDIQEDVITWLDQEIASRQQK